MNAVAAESGDNGSPARKKYFAEFSLSAPPGLHAFPIIHLDQRRRSLELRSGFRAVSALRAFLALLLL
jgi:hypothetical protein